MGNQMIATVYITSINFIRILLLAISKGKKSFHSAQFWKRRASQLAKENQELLRQIQELNMSREIADKVFLDARRKLEEYEYNLELYEEELKVKKHSLLERERQLCVCQQDLNYPSNDFESELTEDEDADNQTIGLNSVNSDFHAAGENTLGQLLVSNASSLSIAIAIDDLMVKTDAEELDCVRMILNTFLRYLKKASMILSPQKELDRMVKVFDHFIPPDSRIFCECELLDDLEYFCLDQAEDFKAHDVLLKAFYDSSIFQSESIMAWANKIPPFEVIDHSENDFRHISSYWILGLHIDSWEVNCTLCDSACDCTSSSDYEKVQEHESKLKWAQDIKVREFYEPTLDDVETEDIVHDYTQSMEDLALAEC